jgi:hypothetical protein
MKKILVIFILSLLWMGLSAQSWPEVITAGMQGKAFRDSINKHLDWKSDSLTSIYSGLYSGGDGIDISAGKAISVANTINPTSYLNVLLGQNEYFTVTNTYGFPTTKTAKFYLGSDSTRLYVDGNQSQFYLDMTDTDFDMYYTDEQTNGVRGGVQIDQDKVIIRFNGTGTVPANSRFYLDEDSCFLSTFDESSLVTNRLATSDDGIFINSDSIYFTNQAGSTDEILFIRSTGSLGSDPVVESGEALVIPLPDIDDLLADRKDGEIKWLRYDEKGNMVWEYGLPTSPGKAITALMAANEINYRMTQKLSKELRVFKIIAIIPSAILLLVVLWGFILLIKGIKLY